jgi:hypothetical protein
LKNRSKPNTQQEEAGDLTIRSAYLFPKRVMGDADDKKEGRIDNRETADDYARDKPRALGLAQNPQMSRKTAFRVSQVEILLAD